MQVRGGIEVLSRRHATPHNEPRQDGGFLDPGTIPTPAPTEPPEVPIVTVTGMPRGFHIGVAPIEPGTSLEYRIENDADAVQQTYPVTSQRPVYHETMPDGTPLDPAASYTISVRAFNVVDEAFSTEASYSLVLNDDDTIAELNVGKLIGGILDAAIAFIGVLSVGGITIDPDNGIVIPQVGGGQPTQLTPNGENIFAGGMIAFWLTVLGGLELRGTDNEVTPGATVTLSEGVTAPSGAPTVEKVWPSLATEAADWSRINALHWDAATSEWLSGRGDDVYALNPTTGIEALRKATGLLVMGVTQIGTDFYVLDWDDSLDDWIVGKFNSSWVFQSGWQYTSVAAPLDHLPAIGNDGTNIVIAHANNGTGSAFVRTFNPTTGAQIGGGIGLGVWGVDFRSVSVGSFDFGASRIVVSSLNSIRVFNSSGTRQTAEEWGPRRLHRHPGVGVGRYPLPAHRHRRCDLGVLHRRRRHRP